MSSISFLNEPLISWTQCWTFLDQCWTFLDHFCHHFWVGATAKQHQTHPKVMTKMVEKCSTLFSTDQTFIRKINTTYRIHTLITWFLAINRWRIVFSKGQLISKGNSGVFHSSISNLKKPKSLSKIIWPLIINNYLILGH